MYDIYKKSAEIIKSADALLITAGAGMGVDSGLPDFRGQHGFWREYPAIEKLGYRFEEMANPKWFVSNPKLAWAFYGHRHNLYRKTIPHKGFDIILSLAEKLPLGYFVVTSNVDGQFQKAGFDTQKIYEIHGNINFLQCSIPCTEKIWTVEKLDIKINFETFEAVGNLPLCPFCNEIARPNILMFSDFSWLASRSEAQSRRFTQWLDTLTRKKIVIIEIGAGNFVPSIRNLSEQIVYSSKAKLIRINPRDFYVPQGQISINTGALEALEKIYEYFKIL
jgi:NAD-dependent SIR2 family protein deacetylase